MNNYLEHERVHNSDPRKDGFIHTAEVKVRWRPGIDIETPRGNRKSITQWKSGVNGKNIAATFRFNPNNERARSPYSGNTVNRGNCRSLVDFENVLTATASRIGLERDDMDVLRADFAVDHYDKEGNERFRKLCDLVVDTFITRHDIQEREQKCVTSRTTKRDKGNSAEWGPFELKRYNKSVQQPNHGAIWRFELRYKKDKKHPDKAQPVSVKEMLEAIVEELEGLPKFYRAAQKQLTEALLTEFMTLQASSEDRLKVFQFLFLNDDRIYSRAQIKDFLCGLGTDPKKARKNANNYSDRYRTLYISQSDFTAFTEYLSFLIKTYLTNEAFFEDLKPKTTTPNDE